MRPASPDKPRGKVPLVPRCATGSPSFQKSTPARIVGAAVAPNVAADHLAHARSTWFRANTYRAAAGRLGRPLWFDGTEEAAAALAYHEDLVLREAARQDVDTHIDAAFTTTERRAARPASAASCRSLTAVSTRPTSALRMANTFVEDTDAERRFFHDQPVSSKFHTVSRPSSAVPREKMIASHRQSCSPDMRPSPAFRTPVARATPPSHQSRFEHSHHNLQASLTASNAVPAGGGTGVAGRSTPQPIASHGNQSSANTTKLRTLVDQSRAAARATAAAEVAALDRWVPRPSDAAALAGLVVGRYRTSRTCGTNFTMWDLATEPPIRRDSRVRAEMAKIFEDPDALASGTSSSPNAPHDLRRAQRRAV